MVEYESGKGEIELETYTRDQINFLIDEAMEYIPKTVEKYAKIIGVDYGRITIRAQKTRWGSCSAKRNLNFNCLLMLLREELRDYVIIHELCHIKEMNHSPAFWKEVEKYCPDHKSLRKELREDAKELIPRLP